MKRTLVVLLAALFSAAPAHAATSWFYGGPRFEERSAIAQGTRIELAVSGRIKFGLHIPLRPLNRFTCLAAGNMVLWNVGDRGFNETRDLSFGSCQPELGCAAPSVFVTEPPWDAELFGAETPLLDEWTNVAMNVSCGAYTATMTGTLYAQAGDNDDQGEIDNNEEADSFVLLGGENAPAILYGPAAATLKPVGRLNIGIPGHEVVAAEVVP
jgi:hypothetical protein